MGGVSFAIYDQLKDENRRLATALRDILLLDGKKLTGRQQYAHAAILAKRALDADGT